MPKGSGKGTGGGAKWTATQREEKLLEVAKLDRRGWDQWSIAQFIGVSQPMVSGYLKQIRLRYKEEQLTERSDHVALMIAQYRETIDEAWRAWEKSKEPAMKEVTEVTFLDEGQREKITNYVEGRLPGSEYIRVIHSALQAIRELEGLDVPKAQPQTQVNVLTLDWDSLKERPQVVDKLEARIAEAEAETVETEPKNGLNGQHKNGDGK